MYLDYLIALNNRNKHLTDKEMKTDTKKFSIEGRSTDR